MDTVIGRITFKEDGTGNVPFVIIQYQQSKSQLVWPKDFATAEFAYPAPAFEARQ